MKINFNKFRNYTDKYSFDNNTTCGVGNLQPLFCKFLTPHTKFSVSMTQLMRLAPMVCPSFARLQSRNDFCFVPISQVFPAYDAFVSNSIVNGSTSYRVSSLPTISNSVLCLYLAAYYNSAKLHFVLNNNVLTPSSSQLSNSWRNVGALIFNGKLTGSFPYNSDFSSDIISETPIGSYTVDSCDFFLPYLMTDSKVSHYLGIVLNADGRRWFSFLRGLGYSLNPYDNTPLSVLPILAAIKACFDVYYPKRFTSWHSTKYYNLIVSDYYNPLIDVTSPLEHTLSSVPLFDVAGVRHFPFYATVSDNFVSACQLSPINSPTASSPSVVSGSISAANGLPPTSTVLNAENVSMLSRLWSYLTKSSVVGQSVSEFFKVHFSSSCCDDMFDTCRLIKSLSNVTTINSVVSTAQTLSADNSSGDVLGSLAGSGFNSSSDSVSFECSTFGFFIPLFSIVPLSGISTGNQYELSNVSYYQQPLPDFDSVGYEAIPQSSVFDCFNPLGPSVNFTESFGFLPRLSSFKRLHSIRSGGFGLRSLSNSFSPYCLDTIPLCSYAYQGNDLNLPTHAGTQWRFPWALSSYFQSYNRLFYNVGVPNWRGGDIVDDNFIVQSQFDVTCSSPLKSMSDSYSIEQLGKDLTSVSKE